jgi:hypothetical protein
MQRKFTGFVQDVVEALDEVLAAFARCEPSLTKILMTSDAMAQEVSHAFAHRYGHALARANNKSAGQKSLEHWIEETENQLTQMSYARIPFFSKNRLVQQNEYSRLLGDALGSKRAAEQVTLTAAYRSFVKAGLAAATNAYADRAPSLHAELAAAGSPPSIVGSLDDGAMDAAGLAPGVGRLLLQVGFATLSPLTVSLWAPGAQAQATEADETAPVDAFALPMLLDLDRDGGVVTDSAATINNTMLRLVALLPAGQVKATIYDPARLGDSASFLFGLGDAAETIIGTKVKTTAREIADALLELEEHITFVTQKYLQGTFDSLTAYNIAADEVAEPYRVLVLYDYPKGFVRPDGGFDVEALARLRKLVEAGPHCGVFTLVVADPTTTDRQLLHPISRLPHLWSGKAPHPKWTALLCTGDADADGFAIERSVRGSAPGTGDQLEAARTQDARLFASRASASWLYRADDPVSSTTTAAILAHVERGVAVAQDVRVSAEQVAQLARAKLARDVDRGTRPDEELPLPSDPSTWWHGSSLDEIGATFARVGARDVGTLRLDSRTMSGAVIGGRPGAGKSILIHALIASLTTRYAPDELELYLVDFKEGVEFKSYAAGGLPHARVVAIESEREFGLSVLESLDEEITRRGGAFRDGAGEEVNLGAYRRRTGRPLPRIVLVVDEFHVLFERDDKLATAAGGLLDRIVRQGRAFGVHAVLASQTLAGTAGLGRHTLNLLPIRIALQCSDADSRLLLADDNADARLLTRPGEGILNVSEGLREANVRFQAAYSAPEERAELVAELAAMARQRGLDARPVVFEGSAPARVEEIPLELLHAAGGASQVALPIGLPLTLAGPVTADLRREPGGNLLLVADDDAAAATLTVAMTALAVSGVHVDLLDFGPLDSPLTAALAPIDDAVLRISRRRDVPDRLRELVALVEQRQTLSDLHAAPHVCVLASLHRARELDGSGAGDEQESLETILRDGPDVGVHVVAWCDKAVSLGRRLSSTALREFGMRLLGPMSRDDSFALVDSELAAQIGPSQAVFDDHDRATTTRVRRFTAPSLGWVADVIGNVA